jgi:hypothetical protein
MVHWIEDEFNLEEWDEYGANDLTETVKRMCHGLEPVDLNVIYILACDAEFSHSLINNLRRSKKRATNRLNKFKGNLK